MLPFIFTSITILLTQLPDPHSISSKLVLLFLASLLDLTQFAGGWLITEDILYCKKVPPATRQIANRLLFLIFIMSSFSVVLMFLLWNLIYLSLAAAIVWALFIIAFFIFIWKPFLEYRKTLS